MLEGDKHYYFSKSSLKYAGAEDKCTKKGSHLTSIVNEDEQDFLEREIER